MPKIVRPTRAYEGEVVRITWTLADGTTYEQEVTIPPPDVRKAREHVDPGCS